MRDYREFLKQKREKEERIYREVHRAWTEEDIETYRLRHSEYLLELKLKTEKLLIPLGLIRKV